MGGCSGTEIDFVLMKRRQRKFLSTVVPIYKMKGSVMYCANYRGVKLLEHGMKVVERLLEKRLRRLMKATLRRIGSFLSVLLIWRRLLIGCQGR